MHHNINSRLAVIYVNKFQKLNNHPEMNNTFNDIIKNTETNL